MQIKPPTDPALIGAMAEIRAVMKKYDIGGVTVLGSRTHQEVMDCIPSWCTIRPEYGGKGVRVKLQTTSDPAGADASLGHILCMRDMLAMYAAVYIEIGKTIDEALKQRGHKFTHTPARLDRIAWHDAKTEPGA